MNLDKKAGSRSLDTATFQSFSVQNGLNSRFPTGFLPICEE